MPKPRQTYLLGFRHTLILFINISMKLFFLLFYGNYLYVNYNLYRKEAKKLYTKLIDHYEYWVSILRKGEKEYLKYVPDGIHPNIEAQKKLVLPHILIALGVSDVKH